MIGYDVLCLGLTHLQVHTLRCHFPICFNYYQLTSADLNSKEDFNVLVSKAWCVFINPKKLSVDQLENILEAHSSTIRQSHAAILLFTDPFTKEQRRSLDTKDLRRVDLRARFDKTLRVTVKMVRKATKPCWDGMDRMTANCFNDGWFLIDMETTGINPLEDDVVSISNAYMANYEIRKMETLYIKQTNPISQEIEELTGSTNEMLENGMTKEQVVAYLNNLPYPAPLILETEKYDLPFLKALYHSCGQTFNLPNITMDGLAAIPFGYTLFKRSRDILKVLTGRRYFRTPIEHPYLAELYDLTLAVFENLQERYAVRFAGDLPSLYFAEIECGN